MRTIGIHNRLRRFRVRLANRILPKMSRNSLDEVLVMDLSISSYSKSDEIPREHYEKVWVEMFKLVQDNTIVDLQGFKKGNIWETKISFISKKLIFKDD